MHADRDCLILGLLSDVKEVTIVQRNNHFRL